MNIFKNTFEFKKVGFIEYNGGLRVNHPYASTHPWEDWAETWAHYLHMTDTLETAAACGVSIRSRRAAEPLLRNVPGRVGAPRASFDRLIDSWFPLTGVLNNLNRGLGLPDAYPFVLSTLAVQKLRFVHDTVTATGARLRYPESGAGVHGAARQRACA